MDPLSILRDYCIRGELDQVKAVGNVIHFGSSYQFPKDTNTAFRVWQSGSDYYKLDAVLFVAQTLQVKHTEYIKQARAAEVQNVNLIDRRNLTKYFKGEIDTCDSIDISATLPVHGTIPPQAAAGQKRPEPERKEAAASEEGGRDAKNQRTDIPSAEETAAILDRNNETLTLERILREERLVRDRNTILLSHKKNFSGILAMLSKPKDDPKRRGEGANGKAQPAPDSGGRYANGKETEQFWKGYVQGGDVADLGIKTTATSDRWAEESGSAQKAAEQARQASRQKPVKKIDGPPIIIVPNAANTLLNIYNAKDFLENGNYVKWDEKASLSSLKPTNVGVMRNINRKEPYPHYQILNVAPKAGSKDWQRVVAVFVIGKLWQFNGWPWSDISEIFNNVKGFHLRYEDEKLDDVIKSWNVKSISLSKFNRHRDKTAALEFWNQLDRFLGAQKKGLTY